MQSFQKRDDGQWYPNPHWTAKFDALNRRIEKNFDGDTTTFYWDSDRLASEVLPDGMLRVYIYADALAMTPILMVDYAGVDADPASGTVYAILADHLGCPERIEDMSGEVEWAAKIEPYGMAWVTEGKNFHQPLRWPGHYYDRELKLHYNRFRTYSPELGRYYEPDPLGRGGGIENVYAYTKSPLFRVDTHGLGCPHAGEEENACKSNEEGKPDEEATGEAARRAKELLTKAQQAEPQVTKLLSQLAEENGGKMVGLDYRLKSLESLTRKLADEPGKPINDALRYTQLYEPDNLGAGARDVMASMENAGYQKVAVKNTFQEGAPYKGINTVWEDPSGTPCEVQFHTPESFDTKQNINHPLYEQARVLPAGDPRQDDIYDQMIQNPNRVPVPENIQNDVPNFRR